MDELEKSYKQQLEELEKALKALDGVNIIIEDFDGKILVGKATYGNQLYMLIGGGIERSETTRQAAISEVEEETGLIIEESDLTELGRFIQRIKGFPALRGFVFFFVVKKYNKDRLKEKSDELIDIQFMAIDEIIKRRKEFNTAYVRMIAWYSKIKSGLIQTPIEKRLGEEVEYTLNGNTFMI